jgi:transposase-like protein
LVCSAQAGRRVTFRDTTGTPFAGSHLSPAHWFLGLFQILGGSSTLGLADDLGVTARTGTRWMRMVQVAIWDLLSEETPPLGGENEIDEVYVVSGWKGCPGGIAPDRPARRRGLKQRGRGSWEGDKPPVAAIVQRQGQLRVRVCRNLQQETFRPWLLACLQRGATVYTDCYNIYHFLTAAGFQHQTVNHSAGEYARGRVHVNTTEGLWSLLRPYLRAFRGVSKVYLPLYVAVFAFIHQHRHLSTWLQTGVLLHHLCRCDGVRLRQIVRSNTVIQACNLLT